MASKLPTDRGSIGEQLDELVAHLIENTNRLSADVARNYEKIERTETRLTRLVIWQTLWGCALVGMIFWVLR